MCTRVNAQVLHLAMPPEQSGAVLFRPRNAHPCMRMCVHIHARTDARTQERGAGDVHDDRAAATGVGVQ